MKDKFSPHIGAVAKHFWGDPNTRLSSKDELRFGTHGARSVDLRKGVWTDHSDTDAGGGVIDLIVSERGCSKADAAKWLEDQGYISGDAPQRQTAPSNRSFGPQDDPDDPGPGFSEQRPPDPKAQIVATYDYTDENGDLIFQVCRMEVPDRPDIPKTFRQRRPDPGGRDGWNWKRGDVRQVPYRLAEVIEALSQDLLIFIVEGEKDADRLWAAGIPATCNAGGAGKWPDGLNGFFNGARVVILPDNDEPGRKHRNIVGAALHRIAREVLWLDLPGLPEKGDPFDWLDAGHDAAELYDLLETEARLWTLEAAFESRFRAITWAGLDDPGFTHEWLVKNLLTRRELSMVAGPSQSGKSFFCLELALAVARGEDFFGHKISYPGGVIYQAGEGGRGIKKRLRAYKQERGLTTGDKIPFVLLPAPLDLHGSDDPTKQFIEEIRHWETTFDVPLELIVVDTFSAATPGANENASEDMSRVLARCGRIQSETNAHVMLVHHMNADGTKPRGHTSIFANIENVVLITKTEENDDPILVPDYRGGGDKQLVRPIRRAVVAKQKDGEDGEALDFVLAGVRIGEDADGDPVTSCIVEPPTRSALSGAAVKSEVGVSVSSQCAAYLRALIKALNEEGTPAPQHTGLAASVRVVRHGYVRKNFIASTFEADEDADPDRQAEAIKKAITRHGSFLAKHGVICKHDKLVWLTGSPVKGFPEISAASGQAAKTTAESAQPEGDLDDLPF